MSQEDFLQEAIRIAMENVELRQAAPFGAVVVRQGQVVAEGVHDAQHSTDPTALAVVQALRNACRQLGTLTLDDCEVYASCEPHPLELAACYLCKVPSLVFAATTQDAAMAGFEHQLVWKEMVKAPDDRRLRTRHLENAWALSPLKAWKKALAT